MRSIVQSNVDMGAVIFAYMLILEKSGELFKNQ